MMLLSKIKLLPREWLVILAGCLLGLSILSVYQLLRGFQVNSNGIQLSIPNAYYSDPKRKTYTFNKVLPAKKNRFAVEIPSDDWLTIFDVDGIEKDPWGKIKFYILTYSPESESRLMSERISLITSIVNNTGAYQDAIFAPGENNTYRVYQSESKKVWEMFIKSPDTLSDRVISGDERIGYCAEVTSRKKVTQECYLQFYQGSILVSIKVPLSYALQHKELKRVVLGLVEDWRR